MLSSIISICISISHMTGDKKCQYHRIYQKRTLEACARIRVIMTLQALLTVAICISTISSSSSIMNSLGNDCKVMQTPSNNYEFDFNPLHRASGDYRIITEEGQIFLVNICGSLKQSCNGHMNVSVCLIQKNGKEVAIGRTNNSVIYDNGRLQFELQGEKCYNGQNTNVTIIMMCNDAAKSDAVPELLPASGLNCTFYFIWYNRYSCTPHKEILCSAIDDRGRISDLSRLTLHSSNYIAFMKDNRRGPFVKIELNVCHSVIMGHETICKFNSGACATGYMDGLNNNGTRNLGDVSRGPFYENGVLKLKYENGDECMDHGVIHNQTSTIIEFLCDPNQHDSHPKINELLTRPCQYHFIWLTFAACPLELSLSPDAISPSESGHGSCVATNPITASQLDLRTLMGQEFDVPIGGGQKLKLSVCSSLNTSSCGENVGSCLIQENSTDKINAGIANSVLYDVKESAGPYLFYDQGAPCPNNYNKTNKNNYTNNNNQIKSGTTWGTLIMFECGAEGPKFYTTFGCKYIILWSTPLVCERKIQCVATNDDEAIDLAPLINTNTDYSTFVGSSKAIINICQPIRSGQGSCLAGSAVCLLSDSNGQKAMSLGQPLKSPTIDETGAVVLIYANGSPCPSNPVEKLSSMFRFVCNTEVGTGNPVFKKIIENCFYQFEWTTSVICDTEVEELNMTSSDCLVYDRKSQIVVDLTLLNKPGGHKVSGYISNKNYTINLCGSNDTCDGAAICEEMTDSWVSYGRVFKVEHDFSSNMTKLFYSKGAPCDSSGQYFNSAEVWLECVEGAGVGQPVLLMESDGCSVLFEWKTDVACGKKIGAEGKDTSTAEYKPQLGLRFTIITFIVIAAVILIVMWYMRLFQKCPSIRHSFSGLMGGQCNQVSYSRQAPEENDDWSSQ